MYPLEFLEFTEEIQIMDVGASAIAEVPIYSPLLELGLAHLNAFEGDPRQIDGIKRTFGNHATIYEDFLFDGTVQTLHLASALSGMTSLLKPDQEALKFFNGFDHFGQIERTEQIQTKRLDDIFNLPFIDILKMDIQGAELTVLKNGVDKLRNCLAIQVEVSYICLYKNQPSFGESMCGCVHKGIYPIAF